MKQPVFADGVMTIFLGDDETPVELKANALAAKGISRHFGGLADASQKVNAYDFAAMTAVMNIAAGRSGKAAQPTEEQIFDAGILLVGPLLIQYLGFLSGGGKLPKDKTAAGQVETAGGNPV